MEKYRKPECSSWQFMPGGPMLTGSNEGFPVDPTPFGGPSFFPEYDEDDDI